MPGLLELCLVALLVYWFCYPRALSLFDFLAIRLHEVLKYCKKVCERHPAYRYLPIIGLQQRTQLHNTTCEKKESNGVFRFSKFRFNESFTDIETSWPRRPLKGICSHTSTTNTFDSYDVSEKKIFQNELRNILLINSQFHPKGYIASKFSHISTVLQLNKYEYPQLYSTVIQTERIQQAIEVAVGQELKEFELDNDNRRTSLQRKYKQRVKTIMDDMHSTLSDSLLRLTSWVLYKLLPCFLSSVIVHPSQVRMLDSISKNGSPIIFLPLHRSHLDYILLTFILVNNNIRAPIVAAGDNLRIPVFGSLLRGLGAFYIKRRIDPANGKKDIIYRAVLHSYMLECLKAGHNMEFFIEGGRTRTGKPCIPKGGLLSVIVDAYMDGAINDAILVPVSINYEKLVDGNFVRELLGQPKKVETFGRALWGIWSVLRSNYGMMRVDFNEPIRLSELAKSLSSKVQRPSLGRMISDTTNLKNNFHTVQSTVSLYGADFIEDSHRQVVERIARHVVFDACHSTAIMSTNALAFLLLNKFRHGGRISDVSDELKKLKEELLQENRDLGFSNCSIDLIHHGMNLLGPDLVKCEQRKVDEEYVTFLQPVNTLASFIELSYYSNVLLPFFILDGILASALCSLLSRSSENQIFQKAAFISDLNLIECSYELCDILQFEFIFAKPCQSLKTIFLDTIEKMKKKHILIEVKFDSPEQQKDWEENIIKPYLEDIGFENIMHPSSVKKYDINESKDSLEYLNFCEALVRPLLDVYVVSSQMLDYLLETQIPEQEFITKIMDELKAKLTSRSLLYNECCSIDPVKNALKLFEQWGILQGKQKNGKKLCFLHSSYDNRESLKAIQERIQKYQW